MPTPKVWQLSIECHIERIGRLRTSENCHVCRKEVLEGKLSSLSLLINGKLVCMGLKEIVFIHVSCNPAPSTYLMHTLKRVFSKSTLLLQSTSAINEPELTTKF